MQGRDMKETLCKEYIYRMIMQNKVKKRWYNELFKLTQAEVYEYIHQGVSTENVWLLFLKEETMFWCQFSYME